MPNPTISQVKLPNGSAYDIQSAYEYRAITSKGTTATTTVGETYGVAGVTSGNRIFTKWFVNIGKTTPENGDIITIKIPVAGSSSGVAITLDGGSNFYPVIRTANTIFTTDFAVNATIRLQFDSNGASGKVYGTKAGVASATNAAISGGCWRLLSNYDSNTTYTSQAAAEGGTTTSLVTTGEKYIWNNIIRTETVGTTTVDGLQSISIGNNIASKTDGNARGTIRIYDNTSHYHSITVGSTTLTEDVSHALPASTGWLVSAPMAGAGTTSKPVYINDSGVATQISRVSLAGAASQWKGGRAVAILTNTQSNGWNPTINMKTAAGTWDIGTYGTTGDDLSKNSIYFNYVTDEDYDAGTNKSVKYRIDPTGLYTGYVNLENVKVNTTSNISTNRLMWTGTDGTVQAWGNYCDGEMLLVGTADKNTYNPNNAFKLAVNGSTYITQKLSVATSTTFSDTTLFVRGKSRIWGNLHLCEKADSSAGLYFGKLASDSGATYTSVEAFYGQINFNSPCLTASTNTLKDVNAGRFTFYQRGFNATTLAPTSYGESYNLPTVTKDRTNSASYNIFTSKNTYTAAEKTAFQTAMGVVNGHTFTVTDETLIIA